MKTSTSNKTKLHNFSSEEDSSLKHMKGDGQYTVFEDC